MMSARTEVADCRPYCMLHAADHATGVRFLIKHNDAVLAPAPLLIPADLKTIKPLCTEPNAEHTQ